MSDARALPRLSSLPDGAAWRGRARSTFQAVLESPNYRRYIGGQVISMAGTWMQSVALGWLVLELTGRGTELGLVIACQFVPVLLFAPLGGLMVDRVDTRRVLILTQSAAGLLALTLGFLTVTHTIELWMVFVLAFALGLVTCVDNPARQTFVLELVGPDILTNAIVLNSVAVNAARVIGPAIAGIVIALVGVGPCFLLNGASYGAVIIALLLIRRRELHPQPVLQRAKGQVREGLRYVRATPGLRGPLVLMALVGTFAYEFTVSLPLLAKYGFDGSALTLSLFTGAMGVGAVVGGLVTASRSRSGLSPLIRVTFIFGCLIALVAIAPTVAFAALGLVLVGAASISVLAIGNSTLQLNTEPTMRGRVMALWTMAFLGSTPIGGPIIGWIGQHAGPRWCLVTGAAACVVAAAYARREALVARHSGTMGEPVTAASV